jgi:hypothetical protein
MSDFRVAFHGVFLLYRQDLSLLANLDNIALFLRISVYYVVETSRKLLAF